MSARRGTQLQGRGAVRTLRTLAGAVALGLLLAPAAGAAEQDPVRPYFFSMLVGANFREDGVHAASGECFLVGGLMQNRYFGYQLEFDATNYSGSTDGVPGTFYAFTAALKLALPIASAEPYVLAGGGVGRGTPGESEHAESGFPLHAAAGVDFYFGKVLLGLEARQVWLTVDHVNYDSFMAMGKFGFRF